MLIDRKKFPSLDRLLDPLGRYPLVAEIILARNVDNVPEIEDYVDGLSKRRYAGGTELPKELQTWLKRNLRNWIVNDAEDVTQIRPYDGAPDWLKKAIERGEKVWRVNIERSLKTKIDHLIDFLRSSAAPKRFDRMTVPEAMKQADQWTERLNKKKIDDEVSGVGEKIIKKYPDGYTWRELTSEPAVKREGQMMGHCAGGYWEYVESGEVALWSLRDPKNEPHCTMELHPGTKHVAQIKGKQNAPVIEKYHPYVKDILNDNLHGWDFNTSELNNAGLFEYEGKLMGSDDLKKDPELLNKFVQTFFGTKKDSIKRVELGSDGVHVYTWGPDTMLGLLEGFLSHKEIEDFQEILEDHYDPTHEMGDDEVGGLIDSLEKKDPKLYKKIQKDIERLSTEDDEYTDRDSSRWIQEHIPEVYDAAAQAISDGWHTGTQDAAYKYVKGLIEELEWRDGTRISADKNEMDFIIAFNTLVTNEMPELDTDLNRHRREGFPYEFDDKTAIESFPERLSENGYPPKKSKP